MSGGGRLRAAFAVEGAPVAVTEGRVGEAVHAALGAQPRETYGDAHLAFAAFMDDRPALTPG